jgi:hypothetical protein
MQWRRMFPYRLGSASTGHYFQESVMNIMFISLCFPYGLGSVRPWASFHESVMNNMFISLCFHTGWDLQAQGITFMSQS